MELELHKQLAYYLHMGHTYFHMEAGIGSDFIGSIRVHDRPCCCPGNRRTDFQGQERTILWTKAVIRAAGTFVSVYFPDILCFAITSSVFWCKSIYWLRDTSRTAYFCSKCDQGFMDERSCSVVPESVVSWSIFEQSLMQSPHRSSYGQKHGQELSSVQHGQSNDLVSCGHWQPSQN